MDDLAVLSERRLRTAGKRITPQRRLVVDILSQAQEHLDAKDIYERGRRQDARLSLATVYRTLTVLKETGVVRELHLDDEHHHYELDDQDKHSHLVCLMCGRVIEVDSTDFAEAATAVGEIHGFEVASAQVELTGYCAECRQPKGQRIDRFR
jgi:Fur family transcriptional regulator, ferric uptake regulator